MRIKFLFVIPLLFGAVEVKSAFNESGLDLAEINPDKTAVGSAEEETEDAYEAPEPVSIDENQLDTDPDPYENDTDNLEAESGEELGETSDFLEDRGRKMKSKREILTFELMIFLGTGRHPSLYKDYSRLRGAKRPFFFFENVLDLENLTVVTAAATPASVKSRSLGFAPSKNVDRLT